MRLAARQMIVRPGPFSLAVLLHGDRVYAFDGKGRLLYAYRNGTGYRRGLDNRVVSRRPESGADGMRRVARELNAAARGRFFAVLRRELVMVRDAVVRGRATIQGGPAKAAEALVGLERALAWDQHALETDAAEYRRIYPHPVSILPPDRYLSVVLQLTEGCAYNRCTFCTFYRDRPFRIKDPADFQAHATAVRRFVAGGPLHRGVFLGDANALVLPLSRLRQYLAAARAVFPEAMTGTDGGFYSFLDAPTGVGKKPQDWAELAALGLRRVYLGVETGSPVLLRFLAKPGSPGAVRELVARLHGAGIAVGVMVMAGVGGEHYAAVHTHRTAALIHSLDLGPGDIVYISEFVVQPDSPYARQAEYAGIRPASPAAVAEQARVFRQAARDTDGPGPQVAVYPVSSFVY